MTTNELTDLIQQKRDIERRIREIKNQKMTNGVARIGMEHYAPDLPDRWYMGISTIFASPDRPGYRGAPKYRSVIVGSCKKDVIKKIPDVIKDLQGLYDMVVKDCAEDG